MIRLGKDRDVGRRRSAGVALGALALCAATTLPRVEGMHWKRRVPILSAPSTCDPAMVAQRRMLTGWGQGAADRDLVIVEVVRDDARRASDDARHLRSRYRIPAAGFAGVLIGKDGNVAMRSAKPIGAADLQSGIDAMPMRRAREG